MLPASAGIVLFIIAAILFLGKYLIVPIIYWIIVYLIYKNHSSKIIRLILVGMAFVPLAYTYAVAYKHDRLFQKELELALNQRHNIPQNFEGKNLAVFTIQRSRFALDRYENLGFKNVIVNRGYGKSILTADRDFKGLLLGDDATNSDSESSKVSGADYPLRLLIGSATTVREKIQDRHRNALELRYITEDMNLLIDYWEPRAHIGNIFPVCIPYDCFKAKFEKFDLLKQKDYISEFIRKNL